MPRKKVAEQETKQDIQYTSEKRRLFHKFTAEDENVLHEKVTFANQTVADVALTITD